MRIRFLNVTRGIVCSGLAAFAASASVSSVAWADYPIASHRYLADPGSIVFDGRVYLYNSNDDDNAGEAYTMKSIVCISTSDMKNWTDHGIVFNVPADASWAMNSWAPQPVQRDGTIYLYFGNSGNGIGVATSKDPTGGFQDAKGDYLVNGNTPGASGTNSWLFDPGVLVDDDGKAYLAFGGNGESNARMIQLGSDLVSVTGTAMGLSPKGFYEASFLFKRNSIYYYAYSTNPDNGLRIDYLKSSSPMSGYTYGGVIGDGPPENGDNNHASEFEFKGQWYHAYHNRIVAKQAGISATYRRNLALEVLDFKDDGSIIPVTYTKDGVPQVGTLNPYVRVEAETMNAQSGIETEPCMDGGMAVTHIENGDWTKVRGVDFGAGAEKFSARVASTAAGGSIRIHQDSSTGTLLGACDVPVTGGAQTWMAITCDVDEITGTKDIVFEFVGSGSALFGFDSWQFTATGGAPAASASSTPPAPPLASGTAPVPTPSQTAGAPSASALTTVSSPPVVSSAPVAQAPSASPATPIPTSSVSRPAATETIPATTPSASSVPASASSTPLAEVPAGSSADGCGCRLVGSARGAASLPLIALAGLLLTLQRRRRISLFRRDRFRAVVH